MSFKKNKSMSVTSDQLVNVELHRAESIVSPPVELEKVISDMTHEDIYAYIASQTSCVVRGMKFIGLEVIMFIYMFSYIMRSVSSTTMIMDKACLVHYGYSEEICSHLADHPDIKSQVEKLATNFHLGHTLIQMIPAAILACFIGSWSDKYSRKIPIAIALIGIIFDGLGAIVCAAVMSSRIEFYMLPAIFTGLSGGFISVLTVIYSYASDTTSLANRTMKYAFMEVAFGLSIPLGQVAGGMIYQYYGYVPVFVTSTAGHVFGLAWVIFVLDETRGLDNTESWYQKFTSFWSFEPVLEGFRATVKRRPHRGREQILYLMLAMCLAILSMASTMSISFLYVHHLYDWDNSTYSYVSAIFSVTGVFVMMGCVPLFKKLKFGDPTLGLVGSISMVAKNIGIGVAQRRGVYFLANLLGLFGGLATLAGRTRISKVTSKNDLGKVFSFLTTAESIFPIVASAVVAQTFNATLEIYPGTVYLIMGFLSSGLILIYIWLGLLPSVDYEEMQISAENDEATVNEVSVEVLAEKPTKSSDDMKVN